MKRYSIILILFCLFLANACGKFKLEGGNIYADLLVTKDDAEEIFGEPMRLEALEKNDENNFCSYASTAGNNGNNLQAAFQTAPDLETLVAANELAKQYAIRTGAKVQTIDGIGEAAWLETDEYEQRLYVRKNKVVFIITFSGDMSKGSGLEGIKNVSKRVAEML